MATKNQEAAGSALQIDLLALSGWREKGVMGP
jgi:hypothetical protein